MKWFRFYEDVIDDPKLMTLAPEAFRFWVQCLCLASHSPERGTLPTPDEIAFRTRTDPDQARALIDTLVSRKLIVSAADGSLSIYKWDHYQKPSDDAGAMKRRQRARSQASPPRPPSPRPAPSRDLSRDRPETCPDHRGEEIRQDQTQTTAPGAGATLRVACDPDEVERLEELCNTLFPMTGWPAFVAGACALYPPAWVAEAMQIGAERNTDSWSLIRSILERFQRQGVSDSEQRAKRAPSQPRASPMQGQMERDRIAGEKWMAKLKQKEASNG